VGDVEIGCKLGADAEVLRLLARGGAHLQSPYEEMRSGCRVHVQLICPGLIVLVDDVFGTLGKTLTWQQKPVQNQAKREKG
jgi:hypothetical protein